MEVVAVAVVAAAVGGGVLVNGWVALTPGAMYASLLVAVNCGGVAM